MAASSMPAFTMKSFCSSEAPLIHFARSLNSEPKSCSIGVAALPSSSARAMALFFIFSSSPEKPCDFFSASRAASPASSMPLPYVLRSVSLPSNASFAIMSAWASILASPSAFAIWFARPSMSCLSRTLLMPRSFSTWLTDPPDFWMLPKPSTKRNMVSLALFPNDVLNSSAVMPATFAQASRVSPPFVVAVSMFEMKRCIEEPAASAFCPVAEAAADHASISGAVMPTTLPMPM